MCIPGYCYLIPLGCNPDSTVIDPPADLPNKPDKIMCPRCGNINDPQYRRTRIYCCFCFISCCPCGPGEVYLACPSCNYTTGSITGQQCNYCNVTSLSEAKHCPNCGRARGPTNAYRPGRTDPNPDNNTTREFKDKSESPNGKKVGEFSNHQPK